MKTTNRKPRHNKKRWAAALCGLAAMLALGGCGGSAAKAANGYETITGEAAKALMDSETGYVILDVREPDEYAAGHIPGAVLLPLGEIADRAEAELTDKDQLLLVYCRSGNRSAQAAAKLAELGYTNVKDFGGINTWAYEVVTE